MALSVIPTVALGWRTTVEPAARLFCCLVGACKPERDERDDTGDVSAATVVPDVARLLWLGLAGAVLARDV